MRALRLPIVRRFSAVAALLLVVACGSPANNNSLFTEGGGSLFSAGGTGATGTGGGPGGSTTGGSSGGTSGSGGSSAGAMSSSGTGGQLTNGGTAGSPSGGVAGSFGGAPNGGAAGSTGGGGASAGGTSAGGTSAGGTSAGGTGGGTLTDCSKFGNNAAYYSETKHCYLVVNASATFATARNHCASLGAHLVTLGSQQENDFVWSLDNSAHWIGATDGKSPKEAGAGTYTWVDGEPFTYTDWSTGQPNASQTTCSDAMGGGTCYEHCAFQWPDAGPGEWNDRLCTHTIDSVCEWDS